MTILEFCKAVETHTRGSEFEIDRSFILTHLNVRVKNCPMLWCDGDIRFTGRPQPLSGAEVLDSPFLLFEYSSHDPIMLLFEMRSLGAIQSAIISEGGILNTFTDLMLPFVNGELKPYELTYDVREVTGPKILGRQETIVEYYNRSLRWLPSGQQTQIVMNPKAGW